MNAPTGPPPVISACIHCGAASVDPETGICSACGRSIATPRDPYGATARPITAVPNRSVYAKPVERKPLIDPLWQKEWLKGSAGAVLFFGVFGFLGGTILLPISQEKPVDLGAFGMIASLLWAVQAFTGLSVIAEWPVSKKLYTGLLIGLILSSIVFGLGDLYNVLAFGAIGGLMLAIRILSGIALIVATLAATSVKQIPLD